MLLPKELFNTGTMMGKFLQAINIDRGSKPNLILLPSETSDGERLNMLVHNGNHPAYTQYVRSELSKIMARYPNITNKNCNCAKIEVLKLMARIRLRIKAKGWVEGGVNIRDTTW